MLNWKKLEKSLGWIAIPQISLLLITLQILGFIMISYESSWFERLALIPSGVWAGEYWRVITFLALPVAQGPIWFLFALWFLYFVLTTIENEWGAFKTTLYVLTSIFLTIVYAMVMRYPVLQVTHFHSTLFLAAAALFPEFEVSLFMLMPVKMKWLAWFSGFLIVRELWSLDFVGQGHLIVIYSNFILFFGPQVLDRFKSWVRRKNFKRKMGG